MHTNWMPFQELSAEERAEIEAQDAWDFGGRDASARKQVPQMVKRMERAIEASTSGMGRAQLREDLSKLQRALAKEAEITKQVNTDAWRKGYSAAQRTAILARDLEAASLRWGDLIDEMHRCLRHYEPR